MTKGKTLSGANDGEKLQDLSNNYFYNAQAIWFLNAYWDTHKDQAEKIWDFVKKFEKLDTEKKAEGVGLDEMNAHRFLESIGETKTVRELRDSLRATGAVGPNDRPKLVPLVHYLLFRYAGATDWHFLVNASQGDNKEEIEEAMRLLNAVNTAFAEAAEKADAASKALREAEAREKDAKTREEEAKAREAEAKARETSAITREAEAKKSEEEAKSREADAKTREAEAQQAQKELEAALAELKAQEDTFNNKTNELKTKSEDESVSVVNRNKAKNELAQHLASDPLPLRKAKITQEAAVKKADKATSIAKEAARQAESSRKQAENDRKAAETARQEAEAARRDAEAARHEAEAARAAAEKAREAAAAAKKVADEALEDARKKVAEAEAFLEEVKKRPGQAYGALWWISRGLEEAKNFLPEKKGGVKKVDTTK
jgi:hypothetical protein